MPADTLIAGLARTRPVTYTVAGDASDDCRDAFVLKHWTEPIEILVTRPKSAPYITFSKYVNGKLTIRVTTPIAIITGRLVVPDAVLCWSRIDRATQLKDGEEVPQLVIRNEKVFIQPKHRGSDARGQGSDARNGEKLARRAPSAPAAPRTSSSPRAIVDPPRTVHRPRSSSPGRVHRLETPAAIVHRVALDVVHRVARAIVHRIRSPRD